MTGDLIVLASASPRRRELLEQIGVPYEVRPAQIDESALPGEAPAAYVERVARAKAEAVRRSLAGPLGRRPVLAADTAVVVDGRVLGKPGTPAKALEMLRQLSGRTHEVLTAVALSCDEECDSRVHASRVRFRPVSEQELAAYCASHEPLDKAGGYAIQGKGAVFIEHLSGSYSSVMGLPVLETAAMLARFGIPRWLAGANRAARPRHA